MTSREIISIMTSQFCSVIYIYRYITLQNCDVIIDIYIYKQRNVVVIVVVVLFGGAKHPHLEVLSRVRVSSPAYGPTTAVLAR